MSANDKILKAFAKKAKDDAEWKAYLLKQEKIAAAREVERNEFTSHCRPATAEDYAAWLEGWLENGDITNIYGYDLTNRGVKVGKDSWEPGDIDWWVLVDNDTYIPELYGAGSINVIIPNGISFNTSRTFHQCSGHNKIFIMDGFQKISSTVPVYSDVIDALYKRGTLPPYSEVSKNGVIKVKSSRADRPALEA